MLSRSPLVLSLMLFTSGYAAEPTARELEPVRYTKLTEMIHEQKGKVVLVDFWGEFCPPCKKEFPNFVSLHRKFADLGLVAISVSLDDPEDREARQRIEKFLNAQNAATRNLLLLETVEFWQEKLKTDGPPCVYLFDQQGRLINRWSGREIDYKRIEKRIVELLGRGKQE
jgi:thiol-disulfide isomerase/thioredoxin